MITANYHTHTHRCFHAEPDDRAYVEAAIRAGFKTLGFSDHSPQWFPGDYYSNFRMRPETVEEYFESLLSLKEEYRDDIDIKIGFEAEYYPDIFPDLLKRIKPYPCDYLIVGQHFLNNEYDHPADPARGTVAYVDKYVDQVCEAMRTGCYTYVAHPDLPHCSEYTAQYFKHMERLIACSIETHVPLEINGLGIYGNRCYPYEPFWKLVGEMGADVVIGVDAHAPYAFGLTDVFQRAEDIVQKYHLNLIEPTLRPIQNII